VRFADLTALQRGREAAYHAAQRRRRRRLALFLEWGIKESSNRPVAGEIVDVVDEAARGEQRDDLRRRLPGALVV
jgi:hypothetical protein